MNRVATILAGTLTHSLLAVPSIATSPPEDWAAAVQHSQPQDAFIEVVFDSGPAHLNSIGYDLRSGAWYRYLDGQAWGFIPDLGTFRGPALRGGLKIVPGPTNDLFIERMAMPFILMKQVLNRPNCVSNVSTTTDGWHLTVDLPAVNSPSSTSSGLEIEIDRSGKIIAMGATGSNLKELKYFANSPPGYPIADQTVSPMAIRETRLSSPGQMGSSLITLNVIEARVIDVRKLEADLGMALAEVNADKARTSLGPGEAVAEGPVKASKEAKYGPALIISGITVLAVGAFAWWRRRNS